MNAYKAVANIGMEFLTGTNGRTKTSGLQQIKKNLKNLGTAVVEAATGSQEDLYSRTTGK